MALTDVQTKTRYMLGDYAISGKDLFTYGASSVFTLTESNAITVSAVLVNDEDSGVVYTYDSTTNKVTITSSLTSGDIIEIDYTYYPNYSDTEILGYINAALVYISINGYYEFIIKASEIYPTPEEKEINLISAIAALVAKPDNRNLRLPDITISVPGTGNLSLDQKISKLIAVFKKDSHGIFFNVPNLPTD